MQEILAIRHNLLSRNLSVTSLFILVFSETICSWLANGTLMVALGWWSLSTKYGFLGSSTIETCFFLPPLFFAIMIGTLSDKKQPTFLIQLGTFLKFIVTMFLFFYLQNHEAGFLLIAVYCFSIATGDSIVSPSLSGYVAKILKDKEFARFVSLRPLLIDSSFLLGGLIAAPIYKYYGTFGVVGFILILYLVANGIVFMLPKIQWKNMDQIKTKENNLSQEKKTITWLPLILFCLIVLFFGMVLMFFLAYSKEFINGGIQFVSFLHAAFVLGLGIAMVAVWIRPVPSKFAQKSIMANLIVCLFLPLLFLGKISPIFPLITFAVIGFLEGWMFMCLDRLWVVQHPIAIRGKASGQIFAASTIARIVGLYGLGFLAISTSISFIISLFIAYFFLLTICTVSQFKQLNCIHSLDI